MISQPPEGKEGDRIPATSKIQMVCGRIINGDPSYFLQAEYRGKRIHFCIEYCREAFLADPDRFYAAHSRTAKQFILDQF